VVLSCAVGAHAKSSIASQEVVVSLTEVITGLDSPIALVTAPGDATRLFVVDQSGLIQAWTPADGAGRTFLDVRERMVKLRAHYDERGLLGLAFHPQYTANGRFFVFYNAPLRDGAPEFWNSTIVVSEFRVSDNPWVADPDSERILLEIDKPQFNNNGGSLAFGPDGYLYVAVGDGGGANDFALGHVEDWFSENGGGNGQDIDENLLGSVLRIDVDNTDGAAYGIPDDNPFVDAPGLDEIFAYGFRSPTDLSFQGGQLVVADTGEELWEEISIVTSGGNYGWNVKEAGHCFDAEDAVAIPDFCPDDTPDGTPLVDPVIEYPDSGNPYSPGLGVRVTGVRSYDGRLLDSQLSGRLVFSDFSFAYTQPNGSLFFAEPMGGNQLRVRRVRVAEREDGGTGRYLLGLGTDQNGELYVLTKGMLGMTGQTGSVLRVERPLARN
jgi:glucose/arabinose dehydrogenase